MARNTITLNNQSSADIAGLIIQELPPITKPAQRTEIETIDGRDGDIVTPLGFAAYDKEFTIGLYDNYDINQVIAYFTSEGTVTFSNEPDKYYNYQIVDQIDFDRLVRYRTAKVKMHCQPFKYSATEGDYILNPPAQNLITIPDFNRTANGVTLSVSDGAVNISGTPSASTEFYVPVSGLNLSAGSYTLSATAKGANPNYCSVRLIGSAPSNSDSFGGGYITLTDGTVMLNATLTASKTFGYLWFYVNSGHTFNFNATFRLEDDAEKVASDEGTFLTLENSDDRPFSKLDLKGDAFQQTYTGKNLFNYEAVNNLALGNGIMSNASYRGYYVAAQPGDTYTLSRLNTTDNNRFRIAFTIDEPANGVSYYGARAEAAGYINADSLTSRTFTVPEGMNYVFIYLSNQNQTITADLQIQLEKSSTRTDFEKYVGGQKSPNSDFPQDINVVSAEQNVKILGRNFLNLEASTPTRIGSYTLTYDSNNVTMEAIQTNAIQVAQWRLELDPTVTYTISGKARKLLRGTNSCIYAAWFGKNEGDSSWTGAGNLIGNNDPVEGLEYTYSTTISGYKIVQLDFNNSSPRFPSVMVGEKTSYYDLQLERGSTASDFQPYQEQSYDISLGKNLLSLNSTFERVYPSSLSYMQELNSVEITASSTTGTQYVRYIVEVPDASQIYYLSCKAKKIVIGTDGGPRIQVTTYGSDDQSAWTNLSTGGMAVAEPTQNQEYTLGRALSGYKYYRIAFYNNVNTPVTLGEKTAYYDIQLEEGSEQTSFVPYTTQVVELLKLDTYRDKIFKNTPDSDYYDPTLTEGAWYKREEVGKKTYTGNETWGVNKSPDSSTGIMRYNYFYTSDIDNIVQPRLQDTPIILSNLFTAKPMHEMFYFGSTGDGICIADNRGDPLIYIRMPDIESTHETVEYFTTWLSTNPTTIYYPHVTPVNVQITDETLIAQLETLKTASAYEGRTHILSTAKDAANLPHIVAAAVIMSSDGTITNSGNTYAKPRMTIYGSGDIGISLNGIQYFQIALGDNGYITIDTAAMEAYQDSPGNLQNRLVTGDYDNFVLNPGENQITFSGIVTGCIVENYSRWI